MTTIPINNTSSTIVIEGKVAAANFAPANTWELVNPIYPINEIIPAIMATFLL